MIYCRQVRAATGVEAFDVGVFSQVYTEFGGPLEESFSSALAIAQAAFPIASSSTASSLPLATWVEVDHHRSHAALGLWDAHRELGLRRPLVLSYDGGGNDGFTLAFLGNVDAVSSSSSGDSGGGSGSSGSSSGTSSSKSTGISLTAGGGVASTSGDESLDYNAALTPIELHAYMSEMNWGNAYAAVRVSFNTHGIECTGRNCETSRGGGGQTAKGVHMGDDAKCKIRGVTCMNAFHLICSSSVAYIY